MSEPKYITVVPTENENGEIKPEWFFVSADDDKSAIAKVEAEINCLKFAMIVPQEAEFVLYRIEKLRKIIP